MSLFKLFPLRDGDSLRVFRGYTTCWGRHIRQLWKWDNRSHDWILTCSRLLLGRQSWQWFGWYARRLLSDFWFILTLDSSMPRLLAIILENWKICFDRCEHKYYKCFSDWSQCSDRVLFAGIKPYGFLCGLLLWRLSKFSLLHRRYAIQNDYCSTHTHF